MVKNLLFRGDDYKEHIKCVSEDQKYGGKGFEAKTNKGDAKQQEWIQVRFVLYTPTVTIVCNCQRQKRASTGSFYQYPQLSSGISLVGLCLSW